MKNVLLKPLHCNAPTIGVQRVIIAGKLTSLICACSSNKM